MTRKNPKYTEEIYKIILDSGSEGITTKEIREIIKIPDHSIKYPRRHLAINGRILRKRAISSDMRNVRYVAAIFGNQLPINSNQLAIVNAIRINKSLHEVDK